MILVIVFIVTLVIGVPIAFVLGMTALTHMMSSGNPAFFNMLAQRLIVGIDNYSLLAIPFFILAGELMNQGGTAKRLIDLSRAIVGHLRGGLAYVNILSSAFLAAMMGSAVAESAAISKIIQPAMDEDNYDRSFSAALTAAASTLGPVIPPSMVFVVYGVSSGTSIGGMFFAGIIPGITLALLFALVVFIMLRKNVNLKIKERMSFKDVCKAIVSGLPALMVPLIILGGIVSGIFTATESAVIASLWALILGLFIYKEIKFKDLSKILINTCLSSAAIMMIMGIANIFGWTLAIQNVPQQVANFVMNISDSPIVILLTLNLLLLFIGCVMEGTAAMIILIPVLLPICNFLGMNPIQFGLIISYNLIIGLITPPVGLCLYSVSAITQVKIEAISYRIWPFIISSVVVLVLVTYWENFTMFIPNLFF